MAGSVKCFKCLAITFTPPRVLLYRKRIYGNANDALILQAVQVTYPSRYVEGAVNPAFDATVIALTVTPACLPVPRLHCLARVLQLLYITPAIRGQPATLGLTSICV